MKNITIPGNQNLTTTFLVLFLIVSTILTAQVGVNTTSPQPGSILDVYGDDKGVLLPRVNITDLSTIAPITGGSTAGLLVYNTNTTTGPGYYYWDGSVWVSLTNTDDWKTDGNLSTNASVNFLGTLDSQALTFRTNDTERFRVANADQVLAMADGSAAAPFYSWNNDRTMGFWRSGTRQLDMVINGSSFFNANANTGGGSDIELTVNPGGIDMNLRVETDNNANTLFIDGTTDAVAMGSNDANGILDLFSETSGLVLPRVELEATNVQSPIVNPSGGALIAGTTVYNTVFAGTSPNNVAPGLYYWNGSRWVAFAGSPGGLDWTLTGNSGTALGTNFLGTTDAAVLDFRTNSISRAWINTSGEVVVNAGGYTYFANNMLQSFATGTQTALTGAHSGTGAAVFGQNTGGGFAGQFLSTAGTASQSLSSLSTGNGILATGGSFSSYSFPGTSSGGVFAGTYGATGISTSTTGTGVAGLGQGRLNVVVSPNGSGIAASGNTLGIFAYAGLGGTDNANRGNAAGEFTLDADDDVTTTTGDDGTRARAKLAGFDNVTPDGSLANRESYYGGYFSGGSESSGTPSYAYVGMRYRTNADGDGTTGGSGQDYKIIGTGSVSTLIDGPDGNPRVMFAPEAPEILFQDFGVGQLVNGEVRIDIDPILKSSIYVDTQNPLKVYVTLEGDCNGVFVTNKSADGFTVKELQGGRSNAAFSWQIVASRADRVSSTGRMVSKHVGVRLPEGPAALKPTVYTKQEVEESKSNDIQKETVSTNTRPVEVSKKIK